MATKKLRKSKTEAENQILEKSSLEASSKQLSRFKTSRTKVILILLIFLLAGLIYNFKGWLIAAVVNGQPISRWEIIKNLEKQDRGRTLENLITKTLVLQEADKQQVQVSDEEVKAEIKKIEEDLKKKGQELDKILESEGMTRNELEKSIKIQKRVEKMIGKDATVSAEEVDKYIQENRDFFSKDEKLEDIKAQVENQIKQQKLNEKFQAFLESLRAKAKIFYFVKY